MILPVNGVSLPLWLSHKYGAGPPPDQRSRNSSNTFFRIPVVCPMFSPPE